MINSRTLHLTRPGKCLLAAALIFLATPALLAQVSASPAAATPPAASTSVPVHIEFDIATFKPSRPDDNGRTFVIPLDGDGFTFTNRPMHDLIRYAFSKGRGGSFRISGQPPWVEDDYYDVQAKVAPEDLAKWKKLDGTGKRLALQGFVTEYLKLKFHQDPKEYRYWALTVAKGGPKMQAYKEGDTIKTPDGQTITGRNLIWTGPNEVTGLSCEMERLADQLSGHADYPVLDRTGLTGDYNFVLRFDPASDPSLPAGAVRALYNLPPEAATPAMVQAVKQLGLQLVRAKGPMDAIVIDHIERPPDN